MVPVLFIVKESERRKPEGPRPSALATIRQQPGTMRALAVLIGAQGLVTLVQSATQQLVVLKLYEMLASGASAAAGLAFGAAGITNSGAAVAYTRVTKRFGFVRTAAAASLLLAGTTALLPIAPAAAPLVLIIGVSGLLNGTVVPATAAMIGMETPNEVQSTIFGINASSVAFGFFLGPLVGGGIAATAGVPTALVVSAVLALGLAGLLAFGAREPSR